MCSQRFAFTRRISTSAGLGKGKNDDSLARVKELKAEMLMVWGRQDPHVPREGRAMVYNVFDGRGRAFYVARVQRPARISTR
ncbi:MAG: hypothetical protein WDM80_08020 [Limisphaerales bacterium]